MKFIEFKAGPDDNDRRFDRVVKKIFSLKRPSFNQSVFALLRKGFIKLNGKKADGNEHVFNGDIISFAEFIFETSDNSSVSGDFSASTAVSGDFTFSENMSGVNPKENCIQKNTPSVKIETVFRNEYVWIINKPYGIAVQPSASDRICLSKIIEDEYKANVKGNSLSFIPGPLHRIDRNTTGLVVFSQNLEGARWFSKAISSDDCDFTKGTDPSAENKLIKKTYIGLAQGIIENEELWKDYIDQTPALQKQSNSFRTVRVFSDRAVSGKANIAVTKVIPLAYGSHNGNKLTLVQFILLTGRKHQIRAASAFHKHPLYGDRAYGGKKMIIPGKNIEYFLHAVRLDFFWDKKLCLTNDTDRGDRPLCLQKEVNRGDRPLDLPNFVEAPLPEDFKTFLSQNLINWDGSLII